MVILADAEGQKAIQCLKMFVSNPTDSQALIFRSKRGGPLLEITILAQCLHPAVKALGCLRVASTRFVGSVIDVGNFAGLNPAVIRQMMGHKSESMTQLYTGEIPLKDVAAACSKAFGTQLEIFGNEGSCVTAWKEWSGL